MKPGSEYAQNYPTGWFIVFIIDNGENGKHQSAQEHLKNKRDNVLQISGALLRDEVHAAVDVFPTSSMLRTHGQRY